MEGEESHKHFSIFLIRVRSGVLSRVRNKLMAMGSNCYETELKIYLCYLYTLFNVSTCPSVRLIAAGQLGSSSIVYRRWICSSVTHLN